MRVREAAPGGDRPVEAGEPALDPCPTRYLHSWRAILAALDQPNNPESRGVVRRLNKSYDGPITFPGKGAQPGVVRDELLAWWNGLAFQYEEMRNRQAGRKATVRDRYAYGRDGTVRPGIAGHEKKRRNQRGG
jgi:hypothetical protein